MLIGRDMMIDDLYNILEKIPDSVLEFLPPICMISLFVIFGFGLRPRHIINFIKNPPVIPQIGKREVKLWISGVFIPFFIIIIIIIITSFFSIIDQIQTDDWEEVDAIVEFAEDRQETTCDAEGNCTTDYWTYVLYTYDFENTKYYGDVYTYLSDLPSGLEEDYPSGMELIVYVDPDNPENSLMVKGWDGIWLELSVILTVISAIMGILCLFFLTWKILFQFQSAENKKIAIEKPKESGLWNANFMQEFKLFTSFLRLAKKANEDVYEGEVKTLRFMIDGEEINREVKKLNDIFEVMMEMDKKSILYLDESGKMGRNIEFYLDTSGEDDMMEVKELLAGELIREEVINLDDDPFKAAEFISSALEASASDEEKGNQWWN